MKIKIDKELFLQIPIILACLVILSFRFSTVSTQAQIPCNNEPPLQDPLNPKKEAWSPGTIEAPNRILVEIFDTLIPLIKA